MTSPQFYALNNASEPVPAGLKGDFTISAPPKTDIWRPTPQRDDFNAPAYVTKIRTSSFQSMQVTVSGNWKTLYDQGGILFAFCNENSTEPRSWIKAGIENEQGTPMIGIVGAHKFSDWSLTPLLDNTASLTLKAVRKATVLWIYAVHNGKEVGLRELTWAFLEDRGEDAFVEVGVYAAKPTPDADDAKAQLQVSFKDFELVLDNE